MVFLSARPGAPTTTDGERRGQTKEEKKTVHEIPIFSFSHLGKRSAAAARRRRGSPSAKSCLAPPLTISCLPLISFGWFGVCSFFSLLYVVFYMTSLISGFLG